MLVVRGKLLFPRGYFLFMGVRLAHNHGRCIGLTLQIESNFVQASLGLVIAALALSPGSEDFPGAAIFPPDADLIAPPSGDLTGKACWLMHGNLDH